MKPVLTSQHIINSTKKSYEIFTNSKKECSNDRVNYCNHSNNTYILVKTLTMHAPIFSTKLFTSSTHCLWSFSSISSLGYPTKGVCTERYSDKRSKKEVPPIGASYLTFHFVICLMLSGNDAQRLFYLPHLPTTNQRIVLRPTGVLVQKLMSSTTQLECRFKS